MFKIFRFERVENTNNTAIDFIKNKKIPKGFIVSKTQTQGRGSRGKKWISLKGNLFLTIFFPINKSKPKFYEFTLINPVLIISVIKKFYKKKNLFIKWPNDILIGKKKVCGILQEMVKFKKKSYLIIGVGINLNVNPSIKQKETTSICFETKKKISYNKFLKCIRKTYTNFFLNLNTYSISVYKKKSKVLSIN
mgnify:CR=1 FL=1